MYYTYMLYCKDGSIYTGIAKDIEKRMSEHFGKTAKCAKYTRSHSAEKLAAVWESENKSSASALEYRIKKLKREKKLLLISDNDMTVFGDRITSNKYIRVDLKKYRRVNIFWRIYTVY